VPSSPIFYIADTCFFVYRYFDEAKITDPHEKQRALQAKQYWTVIDGQCKSGLAKVFILDVCIAEAFKTLAKKYYGSSGIFPSTAHYDAAKKRLSKDVSFSARDAKKAQRNVRFHDIQTSRDIIIGVDRFFENTLKKHPRVGIVDLLILSTARYLIDFLGFDRDRLHIITMDNRLYKLARGYAELPSAFNPDVPADLAAKVFIP